MNDFNTKTDFNSRKRLAKGANSQPIMDIGKMPPQAVDLEEAVLGALMLEKDALSAVIDILNTPKLADLEKEEERIFKKLENPLQISQTSVDE